MQVRCQCIFRQLFRAFSEKTECEREFSDRKDKMKAYDRQYRLRNADLRKDYERQYLLLNNDKMKEYHHRYRARNPDKMKEYERARNQDKRRESKLLYRMRNEDKIREWKRRYQLRHKDKISDSKRDYYLRKHDSPESYLPRNTIVKSWKTAEEIREHFDSIAKRLQITHYTDWYRISRSQIRELGGMESLLYFLFFFFNFFFFSMCREFLCCAV
jgi:hypothetical protein